ncbi:uncharacterized protein LOC105771728 [Gossypium raimondii]|uniref:uncharacterized protein LOC105771728 n=1 Tax=Gossypium raimondii TaxID=29730 RepID=UPI00227C163B|nr:uncharacterized protein LOC105771728 [Gossypium raimondii]
MEKGFLDKVDDNAAVRIWAETTQREKGDSLTTGHMSELWDFARISVIQNDLREMKEVWDRWDVETKQLFYCNYGDLPYLLSVKVDKYLFRALAQFWNPAYGCFTFGKVDLTPTVEEYTTLLRCPKIQVDKAYSRAAGALPLLKKLMNITGMSEQWKRVDVFALGIYGLVVFPKVLGHIDDAVSDLFDRLGKGVTPVPVILAETFRSLNACQRAGEGRFIGCAQLLLAWFHSHFWKVEKISYRVFSDSYSPLEELVTTPRRDDVSEEKWMAILQNLRDEDIEWRAPWLIPDEILYRCGDFDWVPLLGIWGAIGYAPLLVSRQFRSRQFIPATQGLAHCEFSYKEDNYKKRVREMSNAWNQTHRMKILTVGPVMTPEYSQWRDQRVNDNIPASSPETAQSLEEHL